MEDYLDRINKIAELENITISKLETIIGASKNVLHKPIKRKTDIQIKWIIKISENYPQYNIDWLLTGRGEMLINLKEEKKNNELGDLKEKYVSSMGIKTITIPIKKYEDMYEIILSQQRTIENLSKEGKKNADSA